MKKIIVVAFLLVASQAVAEDAKWKPRSIAFLVLEGVYNTELVAPMDVMQHVMGRVEPAPKVFTVGLTKDPVRTYEGLRIKLLTNVVTRIAGTLLFCRKRILAFSTMCIYTWLTPQLIPNE